MTYKRSRLDSSGNFSRMESESTTNFPSAAPPVLDQAAAPAAAAAQMGGAGGSSQVRLGEFLEKCFFCKKSISRNRNVFMYRSCAFCSEECRDRQISIDDKKGKRQNQTTAVIATPPGMNNTAGGHAAAGGF